ncbi:MULTISPECIES: rod-binding protein [unclassified Lebetimonas]|uniref:rod-binding protein n=1 Tax=unclassified Lebetimonas TaxID=2648158 RepID=UPI0004666A6A|nr:MULTISPECIES: rod-binding protein [unclassified Lebetimonas]
MSNYNINIGIHHKINLKEKNLKKLKQNCNAFESEILNFFLKKALKDESKLFPETPGEKIYKSMQIEQISKELGGNFGYSQLLFNYLKKDI